MSLVFEVCKESENPVQTITYFATKGANLNETDGDDNTVLHLFVVRDDKVSAAYQKSTFGLTKACSRTAKRFAWSCCDA